ncbi:hypothetical protein YC2023_063338 [Brassica napus]
MTFKELHPPLTYDDVQRVLEPMLSPFFKQILHPPLTYDDVQRGLEPLLSPFFMQILHPPLTYDDVQRGLEPLLSPFFKQILNPPLTYDDVQRGLEPLFKESFTNVDVLAIDARQDRDPRVIMMTVTNSTIGDPYLKATFVDDAFKTYIYDNKSQVGISIF